MKEILTGSFQTIRILLTMVHKLILTILDLDLIIYLQFLEKALSTRWDRDRIMGLMMISLDLLIIVQKMVLLTNKLLSGNFHRILILIMDLKLTQTILVQDNTIKLHLLEKVQSSLWEKKERLVHKITIPDLLIITLTMYLSMKEHHNGVFHLTLITAT